jgi:hypothetical protein
VSLDLKPDAVPGFAVERAARPEDVLSGNCAAR